MCIHAGWVLQWAAALRSSGERLPGSQAGEHPHTHMSGYDKIAVQCFHSDLDSCAIYFH